jgi:hyperosmotically inducible protein
MKTAALIVVPFFALTLAPHAAAGATPASQSVAESTAKAGDKTKDVIVKDTKIAVQKTKDGLSKTGEVMTDGWITTRVHERFVGEDLLKDSDISVKTNKHVVTLTGTVMGRTGRAKAADVALHTEGVRRVVNRLTVRRKLKG